MIRLTILKQILYNIISLHTGYYLFQRMKSTTFLKMHVLLDNKEHIIRIDGANSIVLPILYVDNHMQPVSFSGTL